jgi:hypothetical protein
VAATHPHIPLAQVIPWPALAELVLPDLKQSTAKGKWWLGRKLKLRIHLGVFLLQWLYTLTDRQVEWGIKDNAAYQLFCGRGSVEQWQVPDHTKVRNFVRDYLPKRNGGMRSPSGRPFGLADPSKMDIDSTVQQANISYPAEGSAAAEAGPEMRQGRSVCLRQKRYVSRSYRSTWPPSTARPRSISSSEDYGPREAPGSVSGLSHLVKQPVKPIIAFCRPPSPGLCSPALNIRRTVGQSTGQGWRLVLDVAHFIRTHPIKPGKILAFH